MSEYCDIKTEFKSEAALIAALAETLHVDPSKIEVHRDAQPLTAWYARDNGKRSANVIYRGYRHTPGQTTVADVGFIKNANGTYTAVLDETEWDARRVGKLKGNYAYHAIRLQQAARGRTVNRVQLANGRQIVTVGGYR